MARESQYQAELIQRVEAMFPGCFVIRLDPRTYQGLPDLLILIGSHWVMLEVKRSANEPFRPNQEYYLEMFGQMSFTSVIFPENEEQVLNDLQYALGAVG